MTEMKQFQWFWAWDDEKEEAWLCDMARKGWHFKSVAFPGNYTFEHGDPRDDVYRMDYFPDGKGKADYLQLFMDAGWQYLGEMNSWQYFRKQPLNGEIPEIYSDNESKAKKYRRMLLIIVAVLPVFVNPIFFRAFFDEDTFGFLTLFSAGLMLFYIYTILNLLHRINELKKKL